MRGKSGGNSATSPIPSTTPNPSPSLRPQPDSQISPSVIPSPFSGNLPDARSTDSQPSTSSSAEIDLLKESTARLRGDPVGAIEILDRVIQNNSNSAEAYLIRASAYLVSAQPQKALDDFDQIIRLQPDFIKVYSESTVERVGLYQIYCLRAVSKATLDNPQAAIPDLEEAARLLRRQEKNLEAAEIYRTIGDLRKGEADFRNPACTTLY